MTTEREMPPLPENYYALGVLSDGWSREYVTHLDGYTADQMREYAIAYAAQEVAREREACAGICIMLAEAAECLQKAGINSRKESEHRISAYLGAAGDIRARGNT